MYWFWTFNDDSEFYFTFYQFLGYKSPQIYIKPSSLQDFTVSQSLSKVNFTKLPFSPYILFNRSSNNSKPVSQYPKTTNNMLASRVTYCSTSEPLKHSISVFNKYSISIWNPTQIFSVRIIHNLKTRNQRQKNLLKHKK